MGSLYQRRDSKGRFIYHGNYIDAQGKRQRKSTRCTDRRAAEAVLSRWEREAHDPRHAAANAATLRAALERLLTDREQRGRASDTLDFYAKKGGHLTRILGGDTPLSALARDGARMVDDFITKRLAEGAARNTIAKELGTLRSALKVAKRRGEFPADIAEVMPVQWSAKYKPRKRCLPNALALQALVDELLPDRGAHVAFFVATGARLSEAGRALRKDIDMRRGVVQIHGTKTDASDDEIPIVGWMRPLLDHVLAVVGHKPGPLFREWSNVRGDLRDAGQRAARALREQAAQDRAMGREDDAVRAELAAVALERGISPNDLRRTHATWLRAAGVDLGLISRQLRHKSTRRVEQVYARLPAVTAGAVMARALGEPRDLHVTRAADEGERDERNESRSAENLVPRDGIEPPTRGFSIRPTEREFGLKEAVSMGLRRLA
jgi:integrase